MNTDKLKHTPAAGNDVQTTINRYSNRFDIDKSGAEERLKEAAQLSSEYYGLATDFYLHGWGRLFHFGVRKKGETLEGSLQRYEMFLAEKLQLKEGEKCLDMGCGVGGPMINIAKKTKAIITGINNSSSQLLKATQFISEEGLEKNCSLLECDWMNMPLPSQSFDKAYGIEATCHAAEKRKELFTEINRLLKPGALFGGYEWVMTEKFDPRNAEHLDIKQKIEIGDGISNLNFAADVTQALEEAGFEILECMDRAQECDKETPWYLPLKGEGIAHLRTSPVGRFLVSNILRFLEAVKIVPKGSTQVHRVLELAAEGLVKGGQKNIFTPMLFFLARKK